MRISTMTGTWMWLVNNIEDPALLYENKSNDKKDKAFVEIKLKGPEKNINALGCEDRVVCEWRNPDL